MQIKIAETLSPESRRARFIAEGAEPPSVREITIDAASLTPEIRAALLTCVAASHHPYCVRERGDGLTGAGRIALGGGPACLRSTEVAEYGHTEGLAQRILDAAAYAPEARAEYEAQEEARAAEQRARRAAEDEHRALRRSQEEAREAAKAAREAATLAWVDEHGSQRLRLAVRLVGLAQCRGIYRDERIDQLRERSGLAWEYDIEASRHADAINPSMDVLRLCLDVRAGAGHWGLDADEEPSLVYVEGGDDYTDEIAVLAYLDGQRVLIAPR